MRLYSAIWPKIVRVKFRIRFRNLQSNFLQQYRLLVVKLLFHAPSNDLRIFCFPKYFRFWEHVQIRNFNTAAGDKEEWFLYRQENYVKVVCYKISSASLFLDFKVMNVHCFEAQLYLIFKVKHFFIQSQYRKILEDCSSVCRSCWAIFRKRPDRKIGDLNKKRLVNIKIDFSWLTKNFRILLWISTRHGAEIYGLIRSLTPSCSTTWSVTRSDLPSSAALLTNSSINIYRAKSSLQFWSNMLLNSTLS